MNSPKSIALVGVGGHGAYHLRSIRTLQQEGRLVLRAVADPFRDSLPERAAEFDREGVPWYGDYLQLLESERDVDILVICTPIPLHEEMVRTSLGSYRGHILLEKPPVPLLSQLDGLIAHDPNRRVRVGFQMVFYQQTLELKRRLAEGAIGEIESVTVTAGWPRNDAYYARASWSGRMTLAGQPVYDGPATNALAHLLHNVCFLLGKEPGGFAQPTRMQGALARARRIESYDTARLRCQFGGVRADVLLTHAVETERTFEVRIRGTRGTASLVERAPFVTVNGEPVPDIVMPSNEKLPMYRAMAADMDVVPNTLEDVRPFTLWTNAALVSSGTVRDIPADGDPGVERTANGITAVRGMESLLAAFADDPDSLPPADWNELGPEVGEADADATEAVHNAASAPVS